MSSRRHPNFTADEIEVLVKGVERNSKVLLGRFSGVVSAAAKSKGWDELAKEVTAVSGISRSGQEVQKKWVCMKSGAKAAAVEQKRELKITGGGTSSGVTTSDSQQRILEVIGKVAVEGIGGGFDSITALEDAASEVSPSSLPASAVLCNTAVNTGLNGDSSLFNLLTPSDEDHSDVKIGDLRDCVGVKPEKKATKRSAVEQQLISLQQKTLDAVVELLDVEKARLELEREKLALKKIKLMTKGVMQDESGNWLWVKGSKEE